MGFSRTTRNIISGYKTHHFGCTYAAGRCCIGPDDVFFNLWICRRFDGWPVGWPAVCGSYITRKRGGILKYSRNPRKKNLYSNSYRPIVRNVYVRTCYASFEAKIARRTRFGNFDCCMVRPNTTLKIARSNPRSPGSSSTPQYIIYANLNGSKNVEDRSMILALTLS